MGVVKPKRKDNASKIFYKHFPTCENKLKKPLTRLLPSVLLPARQMKQTCITRMAQRVRAMKPGHTFPVKTEMERQAALRAAKLLRNAGVIDFHVKTFKDKGVFVVAAIGV